MWQRSVSCQWTARTLSFIGTIYAVGRRRAVCCVSLQVLGAVSRLYCHFYQQRLRFEVALIVTATLTLGTQQASPLTDSHSQLENTRQLRRSVTWCYITANMKASHSSVPYNHFKTPPSSFQHSKVSRREVPQSQFCVCYCFLHPDYITIQ
jgi:hypothetical protein